MASDFLKKKALESRKRIDANVGSQYYGGSAYVPEKKETSLPNQIDPQNVKQNYKGFGSMSPAEQMKIISGQRTEKTIPVLERMNKEKRDLEAEREARRYSRPAPVLPLDQFEIDRNIPISEHTTFDTKGQIQNKKYNLQVDALRKNLEAVQELPDFYQVTEQGKNRAKQMAKEPGVGTRYYEEAAKYAASPEYGDFLAISNTIPELSTKRLSKMTDTEKNVLLYYIGTGDTGSAKKYYDEVLERELNKRHQVAFNQGMEELANKHKIIGALGNILTSPGQSVGVLEAFRQNIENLITGQDKPVDAYSPAMSAIHFGNSTAQGITRDMNAFESLLVQTGLSLGQMAMTLPFGETGSLLLMSSEAAGNAVLDATQRGASAPKALASGLLAGAIEYGTEMLPLDNLFRLAKGGKRVSKNMVKEVLKQTGIEATEELVSEYANTLTDIALMGNKSSYHLLVQELVQSGLSREEAEKQATIEMFVIQPMMAAAGGGLAGGISGGTAAGINVFSDYRQNKSQGQPYLYQSEGEAGAPDMNPVLQKKIEELQMKSIESVITEIDQDPAQAIQNPQNAQTILLPENVETVYEYAKEKYGEKGYEAAENILKAANNTVNQNTAEDQTAQNSTENAQEEPENVTYNKVYHNLTNSFVDTAIDGGLDLDTIRAINELSGITKTQYQFDSLADENGYYLNGVIHINPDAKDPVKKVIGHELAHYAEGSPEYRGLLQEVLNSPYIEELLDGKSLDKARQEIGKTYSDVFNRGGEEKETISELIDKEVFAKALGNLAYHEDAIQLFSKNRPAFVQKTVDFLADVKNKLEGQTEYEKYVGDLQKRLRKAIATSEIVTENEDGGKFSLVGKNAEGVEVYETSEDTRKLTYPERKKKFLNIMKNEYAGRTAKFVRNGHAYYAQFEDNDIRKNIYGDKRSSPKGWKAKINTGANGDIFELVENSAYKSSKAESGKDIEAHKGIDYWDYFVKTVQIDNVVYDVLANVRKNKENQYVYSIQLNENKKIRVSPPVEANQDFIRMGAQHSNNTIAQKNGDVNTSIDKNEENDTNSKPNIRDSVIKSDNFKTFFGDWENDPSHSSKVVDSNGKPLVVYHGTSNSGFDVFDVYSSNYGLFGTGSYFTENPDIASSYTEKGKGNSNGVYPVYLNIRNPIDMDAKADIKLWKEAVNVADVYASFRDGMTNTEAFREVEESLAAEGMYKSEAIEIMTQILQNMGYDGITHIGGKYRSSSEVEHRVWIAFEPEQIKSAIGNKGTFDATDPRIQFSLEEDMDALRKKYGVIPKGENPAREANVPKKMSDKLKNSFAVRTAMEAGITPEEMLSDIQQAILNGKFAHEAYTDKAALSEAEIALNNKGFGEALEGWRADIRANKRMNKGERALGYLLYQKSIDSGDIETAFDLLTDFATLATSTAQEMQAQRLLKKMTPAGQLMILDKTVKKIQGDLVKQRKAEAPKVEINKKLAKDLLNAKGPKDVKTAVDAIKQNVADQVPATWLDKITAWRYMSMLGNPRTHIRNIVGNALFYTEREMKNLIGTLAEKPLPKEQRTKSVLSPNGIFSAKDKALIEFAKKVYSENRAEIKGEHKYENSSGIENMRRIYKNNSLEKIRKFTSDSLNLEDDIFSRSTFVRSFAQAMKARGLNEKTISDSQWDSIFSYAVKEAQKGTFQDASAAAQALNRFKRTNRFTRVLGEGLIPFTKTPINILKRGVEYSPIGIMKGIYDGVTKVRNHEMSASEMVDELSAGLTGSAVMVVGMLLYSLGLVSGGADEDKRKEQFDDLTGYQNYALNIGGKTYTLDWAAPAALPLFLGVEVQKAMENNNPDMGLRGVLESVSKITEPVFEMTMLQGVNSAIQTAAYSQESPVTAVAMNMAENYAGQFIPTIFGQVARTIDPKQRNSYYVDKNSPIPAEMQRFIHKNMAKIPGVSMLLEPKIDQWGREIENGGVGFRALQNFISPGYASSIQKGEVDNELERLYNEFNDSSILPAYAVKYFTVEGEKKELTPKEYTKFAKECGSTAYKQLEILVQSQTYKNLSDEQKAKAVTKIYDYARQTAKASVSDYEIERQWRRQKESGIPLSQYVIYKTLEDGEKESKISQIQTTFHFSESKAEEMYYKIESYIYPGDDLDEAKEKKVKLCKKYGFTENEYMKAYNALRGVTGTKNRAGKTISGSEKRNKMKALHDVGFAGAKATKMYQILEGEIKE